MGTGISSILHSARRIYGHMYLWPEILLIGGTVQDIAELK